MLSYCLVHQKQPINVLFPLILGEAQQKLCNHKKRVGKKKRRAEKRQIAALATGVDRGAPLSDKKNCSNPKSAASTDSIVVSTAKAERAHLILRQDMSFQATRHISASDGEPSALDLVQGGTWRPWVWVRDNTGQEGWITLYSFLFLRALHLLRTNSDDTSLHTRMQ